MRVKSKTKNGFSLLEVIIAMFIFIIVATTVSAVFGKIILAYRSTHTTQKNLENLQYAMNQMAKILRGGAIMASAQDKIRVYDYAQKKCIEYAFATSPSNSLTYADVTYLPASIDSDNILLCRNYASFPSLATDMASGNITGKFAITPYVAGTQAGKITISMKVCSGAICAGPAYIQTTVSLRNKEVNP